MIFTISSALFPMNVEFSMEPEELFIILNGIC